MSRLLPATLLCLFGCENRVSSTEQCLGRGGLTSTYEGYTFEVEEGPALSVAGNCTVVLVDCTVRAPEGIRVAEEGRVRMVGGTLRTMGGKPAVIVRDRGVVRIEGTVVNGEVRAEGEGRIEGDLPRRGAR